MKTMTLLLVLAAAAGCGGDKPKVAKPAAPVAAAPEAPAAETPPPAVDKDTKVSPGLALSGDLAAMCNIKVSETANPKFDYDKDELTPEDRAVLDQLATCLTAGPCRNASRTGRKCTSPSLRSL